MQPPADSIEHSQRRLQVSLVFSGPSGTRACCAPQRTFVAVAGAFLDACFCHLVK